MCQKYDSLENPTQHPRDYYTLQSNEKCNCWAFLWACLVYVRCRSTLGAQYVRKGFHYNQGQVPFRPDLNYSESINSLKSYDERSTHRHAWAGLEAWAAATDH